MSIDDYSTGEPRKHHSLYFEDGNFVMQVENAIFKVHQSLLSRYSVVISEMLAAPSQGESKDGTDEKPLVFPDDSALGWELLLSIQYARPRINPEIFNGKQMLWILPIAHKYCMEEIEADVINELKKNISMDGYVDLMVASQIVGSDELHQTGLKGLISSQTAPNLDQAIRIGVEATHAVMLACIVNAQIQRSTLASDNRECRHCGSFTNWKCATPACHKRQT
ncbi:hypothetical protein M408DRAFT_329376 [Serendipita vermifera MAFF 305830]|uniref:BTB domain-containing protein n=1 Tax=Serendipita vermifera MAFF 305830 TaxID=933852 RepID=A0A0C3AVS7_SERVB|nr:hypothetical protein M408DRAFT_329376 [Serendipita vermifera MAFF 305830]